MGIDVGLVTAVAFFSGRSWRDYYCENEVVPPDGEAKAIVRTRPQTRLTRHNRRMTGLLSAVDIEGQMRRLGSMALAGVHLVAHRLAPLVDAGGMRDLSAWSR